MKKRQPDLQPQEALANDLPAEELMNVASTMECTGLVRTPAVTESQAKSYQDLYHVPVTEQTDHIKK